MKNNYSPKNLFFNSIFHDVAILLKAVFLLIKFDYDYCELAA